MLLPVRAPSIISNQIAFEAVIIDDLALLPQRSLKWAVE